MATENHLSDPLRNPAVDYERADLSARGVVLFLLGLLVCGIFIELVLWGMFRFLRNSEGLFAQGQNSPMAVTQTIPPEKVEGSVLQNSPPVDIKIFPEPRLQTDDAFQMGRYLGNEQKLLNPEQPFRDQNGALHISIDQAMKLIQERGLPVRPEGPPPDFAEQSDDNSSTMKSEPAKP